MAYRPSVQIVARPFDDRAVFRIATMLEQQMPAFEDPLKRAAASMPRSDGERL